MKDIRKNKFRNWMLELTPLMVPFPTTWFWRSKPETLSGTPEPPPKKKEEEERIMVNAFLILALAITVI